MGSLAEDRASSPGFVLCSQCGDYFDKTEQKKLAKGVKPKESDAVQDSRATLGPHAKRCNGTPDHFSLGHKRKSNTLRLVVPDTAQLADEAVAWSWSLLYALVQGAVRLLEVDEDDLEAYVLTRMLRNEDGPSREEPLDMLLIDPVLGGSGLLQRLAENLPLWPELRSSALMAMIAELLLPLPPHVSESTAAPSARLATCGALSESLDRREGDSGGADPGHPASTRRRGTDWDAGREEGCESPQELNLLQAIRTDSSPTRTDQAA